jgi:putative ABC transport system permease protein
MQPALEARVERVHPKVARGGIGGVSWLALRMLTGDRGKYFGLIFSISFASMLMAHQASIFWSLMQRTTSQILDVEEADVWVMDRDTTNIDDNRPLRDDDLLRVRGVPGVAWAAPLHRSIVRIKIADGRYRQSILMGVDEAGMAGAPRRMLLGDAQALRQANAIILDKAGFEYLWPGEPLALGRVVELNDHRAVIAGICETRPPFVTLPVAFASLSEVTRLVPPTAGRTSFIIAKAASGEAPTQVAQRVQSATGLAAMTDEAFAKKTIAYWIKNTGIPVNFGITVTLAFIVGAAVAGQTFYMFTLDNLKQFGALKAMGVENRRIVGMILLQALVVGLLGYAIGMGLAAAFFESTRNISHLRGFGLLWTIATGTGVAVLVIVLLTALFSVRRVLVLEPAAVFR